jgi:sugar lactone lactonase YvrE
MALLLACLGGGVVVVAGGGTELENCPATQAKLFQPFAVDFDAEGNLYFVEIDGYRVMKIDKAGRLTRVAGTGLKGGGGDGGPAMAAQFDGMHHLLVGGGRIYVADTSNSRVRVIDLKAGTAATLAGTGQKGFDGDGGPAARAKLGNVYCLALDPVSGRLLVDDLDNRRIRAVDLKSGRIETVAGNGQKGVPADGARATEAPLVDPRAVAADSKGRIYILERGGHALRVVGADGTIRTVAGTGKPGFGGDGGDALNARMNGPKHLCVDREDNVLIVDTENHVVRKYTPRDGKILRVAGTGKAGAAGVGGPPEKLEMARPHGVTVGPDGALYVSDSDNRRILKVEP